MNHKILTCDPKAKQEHFYLFVKSITNLYVKIIIILHIYIYIPNLKKKSTFFWKLLMFDLKVTEDHSKIGKTTSCSSCYRGSLNIEKVGKGTKTPFFNFSRRKG